MADIIHLKTGNGKHARAPRIRRILKITLVSAMTLIVAVMLIVAGIYYHWSRNSLPARDGQIKVRGLQAAVTVKRDGRGIPFVSARNRRDLYFAQGYVTAQDRLWQMDLLRRTATGRLSELFGERSLEFDKRQRNYGFRQISEKTIEKISPELREILESYAAGVNAYLEENRGNLPIEFRLLQYEPESWQPSDSIATGKLMAQTLASSWEKDVMRGFAFQSFDAKTLQYLLPEYSPLDQIIVGDDNSSGSTKTFSPEKKIGLEKRRNQPDEIASAATELLKSREIERQGLSLAGLDAELPGSNNWVVSGSRTETGKPFLANDPHLGFGVPSVWHQIQLQDADDNLLAGVTFPGTPGIIIGHNAQIAWGVTNAAPDVQDIYVEEFSPDQPDKYRVGANWQTAEIREETIKVRQSTFSAATRDETYEVVITRHGPIVGEQDGKKLALRWTGLDETSEFD